jgi:peptidoglycan/LPS O-acetylase OafA/YrhL
VEEEFYLLWPLCVWLVSPKNLRAVAVWLSVLAVGIRVVWAMHGGLGQAMSMMTFGRMDALLIGAIIALLYRDGASLEKVRPWLPRVAVSMIVGFFGVAALLYGRSEVTTFAVVQTLGYSMLALGFGALVLHSACTEGTESLLQKTLANRGLAKLGAYSYGFYVFHVPVIGAAKMLIVPRVSASAQAGLWFAPVLVLTLGLITFGIAAASYELFEEPILNYKRYFEARFAPAPGPEIPPVAAVAEVSSLS